jgi:probable phosphoglycerate mutase
MSEIQTRWGPLPPLPLTDVRQVILLRHGQTTANADGIIQGWIDFPLTALGRRQAEDTAAAIRPWAIDRIFSSPIGRAQSTARILADACGVATVETLPGMTEAHAGAVTGRTWAEFAEVYPDDWRSFQDAQQHLPRPLAKERLPGWEPAAHIAYRTWHALGAVLAQAGHTNVLIVSHGDTIDCLLSQILAGAGVSGHWRYAQPNCGISRLVAADGRLTLPAGVQVLHQQAVT